MRVRKKNWALGEIESNPIILTDVAKHKGKWHEVFGNDRPVYVEIGCGKGNFITENALKYRDINFIAIEREQMVIVEGARKIRRLKEAGGKISNILFVADDALHLSDMFSEGEIGRIYLNFSDPWPNRKKWAKRRLTHRNFLDVYERLLGGCGEIHMKTDNTVLFEFSLNEFAFRGWGLKNISLDLHNSDYNDNIVTEYELKFSGKGQPIYRLEAFLPNLPALRNK